MGNQSETVNEDWVDDSEKAISAGFIEYFALIKDPKTARKTNHSLLEIIFTTICAYICGANSWEGVVENESGGKPCSCTAHSVHAVEKRQKNSQPRK